MSLQFETVVLNTKVVKDIRERDLYIELWRMRKVLVSCQLTVPLHWKSRLDYSYLPATVFSKRHLYLSTVLLLDVRTFHQQFSTTSVCCKSLNLAHLLTVHDSLIGTVQLPDHLRPFEQLLYCLSHMPSPQRQAPDL